MLKTAIIGITGYGKEHLRLLLHGYERHLMQPVAAVCVNPGEAERELASLEKTGCRIYSSVAKLWERESGQIDLCMIPSPIGTHYTFARQAVEHGSHVFLEKPACGTVEEVHDLMAFAKARGREICMGFQDRYSEQVQHLKCRMLAGDIGKIVSVRGYGVWPRPQAYYERNNWAGKLKNNGNWVLDSPINNAMAHFLMLMLYWAGEGVDRFARPHLLEGELYRIQDIESFDTASLRLETEEGIPIYYAVSHSGLKNIPPLLRVEGECGYVEWTFAGKFKVKTEAGFEVHDYAELSTIREHMIENVCAWVTSRTGKVVPIEDALIHTRIVNGLHQAFPIHTIAADLLKREGLEGKSFTYLPGLEDDMKEAHASASLLCELRPGTYPARPGSFSLKDYTSFEGTYAEREPSIA